MKRAFGLVAAVVTLTGAMAAEAVRTADAVLIIQKGRAFSAAAVSVKAGETIRFSNADSFLHEIFIHSPSFNVDSDEQRPGESVDVPFPVPGTFTVLCAIHPRMALTVDVR